MSAHRYVGALIVGLAAAARGQTPSSPPPTNLWAAQTSAIEITLAWRRVPGAVQYRLYTLAGDSAQSIGWTQRSGDRFVQRVSEYGVAHRYAIDAVFENGTISERVRFNDVVPVRATPVVVAGPSSVTAEPIASGVIAVRWNAVPDATAYMISRSVAPAGFRLLCSLCPTGTTYLDSATTAGATHAYMVVALSPRGPSRPTRSGTAVPQGAVVATAATPAPNAPSLTAAPKGTIRATPRPGSCLALGAEGNFIVRLADGSVLVYERVQWLRRGPTFPKEPKLVVVPGISDAVAVATSGEHWLALRSDGTILSWGKESAGRLGRDMWFGNGPAPEGAAPPPETPAPVREITNAVAIAAGADHSVALLADSTIRTWGTGSRGVPGDGSPASTTRSRPARVKGIDNAVAVDTRGGYATYAVLADGTIRAWGWNRLSATTLGALGSGTDVESTNVPLPVVGITNAIGVAAGSGVAALMGDGTLRVWGFGYGPPAKRGLWASNTPLPMEGVRDAIAISPFMALLRDGTVREFGAREWPWATPKLPTAVVAVASDIVNRLALLADGKLIAWGHKRWYPNGPVLRGELGAETARQCAARGLSAF